MIINAGSKVSLRLDLILLYDALGLSQAFLALSSLSYLYTPLFTVRLVWPSEI